MTDRGRAALRTVMIGALAGSQLVVLPARAAARAWAPQDPVEFVIGVVPGGAMDRMARLVQGWMVAESLVPNDSIVLPKPGGGHAVALSYRLDQAGDPETVMAVSTLLISNSLLGRSPLHASDFTPLGILCDKPMVFAVRGDSDIADAQDLANRLAADPASLSFSVSSGLGTANLMAAVLLAQALGADISQLKAVTFESGAEGITAALGGHVDVVVTPPGSMAQFVRSGELRIVALAADERASGILGLRKGRPRHRPALAATLSNPRPCRPSRG